MRICIVYDCLFPYTVGGGERWFRSVAERLAEEGHEVTYLTLRQWPRREPPRIDGVRVVAVGPGLALYTASGRRRILPPLIFGLGVLAHLLVHGRRYDVVHACGFPYFSLLAAAATRRPGGFALEVDWFEVWSPSYWREYLGPLAGRAGLWVQSACARVRQRAFCFSRLHAQRLREEGLRGEVTLLRGLYAPRTVPEPSLRAEQLVLFAGRLIPEKQAPLAVQAIAAARMRLSSLRGAILGDGPEREELHATIARLGLGEQVLAPGFTDAAEVQAYMQRALCLLLTSRREGYGMVVVEAAAHGTPSIVLAGPDNAAVELIEEGVNGFVCASSAPESIAAAIVAVHERGSELRASTARWFAEHAQELSLESSLRTVLAHYREGSDGGGTHPTGERDDPDSARA